MRSVSARSTGIAFLCVAICSALLIEGARRAAAGDTAAQVVDALPVDCGAGVLTPVKVQVIGTLVAKAYTECINGTLMYMRLNVKLQKKVDGVWRWRAGAIGQANQLTDRLVVKVSAPCRVGPHRTFSVHLFRQNLTDPWQVGLRWASPPLLVSRCST